ncbi:MAG: methyltransferase family protein [Acidobacteriota bacterium]
MSSPSPQSVVPAGPRRGLAAKSPLGRLKVSLIFLLLGFLAVYAHPRLLDIWLGLPFVLAGSAVRLWASGYLLKTRELAIAGPYAYTRNPLYLGRLLLFTGFALMGRLPAESHLILLVLGYAVFFGYYLPRKEQVECSRLRSEHGEAYSRYEAVVPALLPRFTPYRPAGLSPTGTGWDPKRFRRNREYLMLALEAGLVALFTLRALS